MSLLLTVGLVDHDHADWETDTAMPDDEDDIPRQSTVRISAAIKLPVARLCPHGAVCFRFAMFFSR